MHHLPSVDEGSWVGHSAPLFWTKWEKPMWGRSEEASKVGTSCQDWGVSPRGARGGSLGGGPRGGREARREERREHIREGWIYAFSNGITFQVAIRLNF